MSWAAGSTRDPLAELASDSPGNPAVGSVSSEVRIPFGGRSPVSILGVADRNLAQLERAYPDVRFRVEADALLLRGSSAALAQARRAVDSLVAVGEGQHPEAAPIVVRHGSSVRPKTNGQQEYVNAIDDHTIVFGIGPAGTGKTYLAMAKAVQSLLGKEVDRIVLTRPAVEAGERLGFLPGSLTDKIDPYLRPLHDALAEMLEPETVAKLTELGVIEVAPLAYMRGRTLNNAFVILDEAQNTTAEQMKMFLTRLGFGSRMVVTGDASQIDLPGGTSGLRIARRVLRGIPDIAFVELSSDDVVRHRLVGRIVDAYARFEEGDARDEH
jgi:phosphate starvation-inducible PhoH-like protein